jgi:predicted dehydrogenase
MLADAAARMAARQASKKTPRTYGDYRKMLAEQNLDIMIVTTPNHWHTLPTIAAIATKTDVYVEKPISVDVIKKQAIIAAARRHGRVVQMNTQRRSTPHLIEARDQVLRAGELGRVGHVETYGYFPLMYTRNFCEVAFLSIFDYEMWMGSAPLRPYNELVHSISWRAFMEYGNGTIGDIGIHMLDMVRWMLELGAFWCISSSGGIFAEPAGT